MKKKKILVIDDDQGILDAFEAMLESPDYDVEVSSSPDRLLKQKSNLPDLIFLDVLLSGVDGRDICRKLKSMKQTKDIPIVIVSAHPSVQKSVKEAGSNDYLPKPFEIDELLGLVKKYLRT